MHEKGYLTVYYGSIINRNMEGTMIDNMSIIVDKESGSVISYGDTDRSNMKEYYQEYIEKIRKVMPEDVDNYVLISFERYNSFLNIDEICSLTNYLLNHVGPQRFNEIFTANETQLKEIVKRIQDIGF